MKKIQHEVVVGADQDEVWNAWTTAEGARTFFGRDAQIELRVDGPYEIWFNPAAPQGERGGEGCRVLSFLPKEMISFTWNAPPSIPAVRSLGCASWVVVEMDPLADGKTRVRLTHLGWRDGREWDETYAYFIEAWKIVLNRLINRFIDGPIAWPPIG